VNFEVNTQLGWIFLGACYFL